MKRRNALILLIAVLLFVVFPALAEPVSEVVIARGKTPYSVVLDKNNPYACLDEDGYPSLPGSESNYHYKFENGVLTLRNAFTNSDYVYVLVEEKGDLLINLVGDNRIKLIDNKYSGALSFGGPGNLQVKSIESIGNVTFDGTGTIEAGYVDSENKQHADTTAVFCAGQITVNSGTLSAWAYDTERVQSPSPGGYYPTTASYAIWGKSDMVVNGGKVIARSGKTPDADSFAIALFGYQGSGKVCKMLTIKGGEVEATAGASGGGYSNNSWINSFSSAGVYANVTLEGGSLTTKSLGVGSYGSSCGIISKITQSGGTLIAEGGPITSYSSYKNYEFSYGSSQIEFIGGTAVLNGASYAVRTASIDEKAEVTSSTKQDGSAVSEFDPANIKSYRYLKLKLNADEDHKTDWVNMPETGDDSSLGFMLTMFAGASFGMYILGINKKRRYW